MLHAGVGAAILSALAPSQGRCEVGADVPFVSLEAEESKTVGQVTRLKGLPGPDETSPAIEASGRAFVKLKESGDYCEWESPTAGNAIILRHSIPDAPAGGGATATLSLYVDGEFRQKLSLDSRYNWLYGDRNSQHGGHSNDPQAGPVRVFWNDARFLLDDPWPAGATIRLQKDADNSAAYYDIDLIDLETAPKPLEPPKAGTYLSVADFGGTGDDESDDTEAIETCLAAANEQGKVVWLPAGSYLHNRTMRVDGVAVQGAGMWHTRLIGTAPQLGFVLAGERPSVRDLYVASRVHTCRTDPGGFVFRSRKASKWAVERVWMTHVHVGFWLGGASDGAIRHCRIYATYADAINLNRGSSRNVVEHNYIRTAGDDGIATLSFADQGEVVTEDNVIRSNTIVANWWGHNIDVAGGRGHVVEDNYLADNSHSGCFTFNLPSAYPMQPLTGTVVRRNHIIRGGGNHAGQERGAIWSFADDAPISGVVFEENEVVDPVFRGLHLHGASRQQIEFKKNRIDSPGTDAIRIDATVRGRLTLEGNQVNGVKPDRRRIDNSAGDKFEIVDLDKR